MKKNFSENVWQTEERLVASPRLFTTIFEKAMVFKFNISCSVENCFIIGSIKLFVLSVILIVL